MTNENTAKSRKNIPAFAGLLVQDIRTNFRRYLAAIIVSAFASGVFWIWATGGIFFNLPGRVAAMEIDIQERQERHNEALEHQQSINQGISDFVLIQGQLNKQTEAKLTDILTQVRDINSFLRGSD